MALPNLSAHAPNRSRVMARQLARQREQEARCRQQWDLHARYYKEQTVCGQKQAVWSSQRSFNQSMSSYQRQRMKEEDEARLEERRTRLGAMLQKERRQLEAELRALVPDDKTLEIELMRKTEELRTAREERSKKVAQELLKEHWRKNNAELREVESSLHLDHVVGQWQEQISEKKQQEEAEQQEQRHFENEYERTRREALERMEQTEEKKKAEERQRAQELCKQMEELNLREKEAARLKKEQEDLLLQQWELEKIEEERMKAEERKQKSEMGEVLIRQYRAQLKRRTQQVQEELEADRKILEALVEGEEDRWLETARRERAVADAAWMKQVIEEQLELEREREDEIDVLHRAEARHVWEKREALWEKEKKARELLMQEVLAGRQQQLEQKMQKNREAQAESLRRREELIEELEQEKETRRREKEQEEGRRTQRIQELDAQVAQQRHVYWEEQRWKKQEEEQEREAKQIQEEELRSEMQRIAKKGHQEKIHSRPRSAWT